MAKVTLAKQNFTAGEITPRLSGRTDLGRYDNAAQIVENFLVQPHGGLGRRPGTQFIREVKTSSAKTRLIPFQFNVEQAYILEFGNQYFRVYKDGGIVVSGGSPVEFATPYTTAQLDGIKFAQTADVMYIAHPDHSPRKLTRTSHTAWTINEVVLQRGAMLDQNLTDTTLTASARTGNVTITASADTFVSTDVGRLVKLHKGFAKITAFTNATTVTAAVQELEDGRSELMPSYTANTISFHEGDPDSTGLEHNDRIEDSAGDFITQGFENGMKITISSSSSNNGSGRLIVDVTDTVITLAPGIDLANESAGSNKTLRGDLIADSNFSLGAFSNTTGFPRAVAFYEQRLVFAGTSQQPQTIFFSQSGDFENFERGTNPDDGLVYTIGSNEVNVIRYLASGRQLIVGTSGGEFVVRASGFDEPLKPDNTQIKQQTTYGSADIQPMQVGNATLFLQRAKRKLRELVFSNESDSYVAPDMTILAEHITEGGITAFAYQQEPDSVAWTVRTDGVLSCMTYRREEQVVAWHRHIIGGVFGSGNAIVESIAVIPGDVDEDEVYMIVKRTINGATKRYVERLSGFDFGTDVSNAFFVDSGLTYSGSAATTISGLNHLEGQTVSVLANGSIHPNVTVSSGAVTLQRSVTKAHIGLPFTSKVETLRIDSGSALGSAQGKIKRISEVTVRLFRSVGLKVGTSSSELDIVPFRDSGDDMDTAIPLFTGDKKVEFRGGYDEDATIVIEQSQPLPLTILAIFPTVSVFDK
ncbi:MAG: hypothetical protein Unbinned2189contig1000_44 [Prokaryotic dsDNA virus sp.]|nr:MAG: hypothetical protein Unbinned2189contig1000_44 [Prokaryotic dsDNA virus sp.]|tara:strand:+ start:5858 stop:8125 length:2268 start_codon:yes stop_codon:yes gene_type:complete